MSTALKPSRWVTVRKAIRYVPGRDSGTLVWLRRRGLIHQIDDGKRIRKLVDLNEVDAAIRGEAKARPQRKVYATGTAGGVLSWDDL